MKINLGNYAKKNDGSRDSNRGEDEDSWGNCFMAESSTLNAMASVNFQNGWIVDSDCGHHLRGDESKFLKLQSQNDNEVIVTADNTVHKVENEGTIVIND